MTILEEATKWVGALMANPPDTDRCILWPFSASAQGYGYIKYPGREGKKVSVTRMVLTSVAGPPPTPKHEAAHAPVVCHNRTCVNPRHLRWATRIENQADRLADGTHNRGAKQGGSKLTPAQVVAIRQSTDKGRELASRFGISEQTVCDIRKGRRWNWLTDDQGGVA